MSVVSRSEFARMAGVTPAAITQALKGKLKPAAVADRIDSAHIVADEYLKNRSNAKARKVASRTDSGKRANRGGTQPTAEATEPRVRGGFDTRTAETPIELTEDFEQYADYTLRRLCEMFGTGRAFRDWLEALKKLEDTRGKRLDNDTAEGHVISREAVRKYIVGAMHSAFERLLRDAPRTITARVGPMAKAGESQEDQERETREIIGSLLRPVLDECTKSVKKLS